MFKLIEEHVKFKSGNNLLAGTLTMPELMGMRPACPGAVLIHGSGPFSRDAVVYPHRPFKVIAEHLAFRGISVLRYDKRGVAESQGTMDGITTYDLADDAAAAVEFLKHHQFIKADRIGLIGQSEGGLVASMTAAKDKALAFVVMLAAPAILGQQILLDQTVTFAKAAGESEETIARKVQESKEIFAAILAEPDDTVLRGKLFQLMARFDYDSEENNSRDTKIHSMSTPWFRTFLTLEASKFVSQIACPVLAMCGTQDTQVLAEPNLAAIEAALASGSPRSTAVKLPGLNHMLQHCVTGMPWEYPELHEAISPFVIDLIADWVWSLFAQASNGQGAQQSGGTSGAVGGSEKPTENSAQQ